MKKSTLWNRVAWLALSWSGALIAADLRAADLPASLTPAAPLTPLINGPGVFGVRPGSPFLYTIPATGERPVTFAVDHLPKELSLDAATGRITGRFATAGEREVVLRVSNRHGGDQKKFRIIVGDNISLAPAMGWNSWNCWAAAVDQEKVLRSAHALVAAGLANYGWTFINIDDTWQGKRTGPDHALQANEKFPEMKKLCDEIHALGLKPGIYSTPWVTSYAKFPGGSSNTIDGTWTPPTKGEDGHVHGKISYAAADAKQWAAWGFDYLKYDWNPNDVPHTAEMSQALRQSGRDIIFSISNTAPFDHAADWARLTNSWRTTGDIWDRWAETDQQWQFGVSEIGFSQTRWAPHAGPGHWNDPDMLVVGKVGWGPALHPTGLTADEQYTHLTLWCMLSAPLLIGCDLEQLDPFTIGLLTNREILALDQDSLGRPALTVATIGPVDVLLKELEDGSKAVAFFNRDSQERALTFNKLGFLGFGPKVHLRDLWRQVNLPDIIDVAKAPLKMTIPAHGVVIYKVSSFK